MLQFINRIFSLLLINILFSASATSMLPQQNAFYIEILAGTGTTFAKVNAIGNSFFDAFFGSGNELDLAASKKVYEFHGAGLLNIGYLHFLSKHFGLAFSLGVNLTPVRVRTLTASSTEDITDENYVVTQKLMSKLHSRTAELAIDFRPVI